MKYVYIACGVLLCACSVTRVVALPQGETVNNGSVSFERNGSELLVHQETSKAIVNYSSFNVAGGETVRFNQPSSSAAILNRISGGASTIAGSIQANGNVFLLNRSGILFSPSAQVNVHGLVASSMELSNADFLSNNLAFTGGGGSVVNQGSLNGDFVYLVGGSVQNSGSISASKVALAAGKTSVKIDEAAGGEISLIIDGKAFTAGADGAPELASSVVDDAEEEREVENGGEVAETDAGPSVESEPVAEGPDAAEASAAEVTASEDVVEAEGGGLQDGDVINDGEINVSGDAGGQVAVAATRVANTGSIHADGSLSGGGNIDLLSRETLVLSENSVISANAGIEGAGGRVILYTEGNAYFPEGATVDARGGSESGAGGFVELSGVEHLELATIPDVSSVEGQANGEIFIDPTDIDITFATTGSGGSFNATAPFNYTPTAGFSEISAQTISLLLNNGDVTISTASAFNAVNQGSIRVLAPLDFFNIAERTLTLIADNTILVDAEIRPGSVVGPLNLNLMANNGIGINQNITLEGGDFNGSANEDGGTGDFNVDGAQIFSQGGNLDLKGDNFFSDTVILQGMNIRLEFTTDIDYVGDAAANETLVFQADRDVILDGSGNGFFGVDGIAVCADHDMNLDGDVVTTPGLVGLYTDAGPIMISGNNLDLSSAEIKTPNFAPNIISILATQNINLNNPSSDAFHFGSDIYVQAGGTVDLSTPLVGVNQVLVSSGGGINAFPHSGGANIDAQTAGLQSLGPIGSTTSPVTIHAPNQIFQTVDGGTLEVVNQVVNPTTVDFAASGDLSSFIPPQIGTKAVANIVINNQMGSGNGNGSEETLPDDEDHNTVQPDEPVVVTTDRRAPTPRVIAPVEEVVQTPSRSPAPVSLLQEAVRIPAFGSLGRQGLERARASVVVETPSAKVTAVQFGEFYFMHEKMQISEFANDLDLYFIDYLVFGVAEITADARLPVDVKGSVIHGGPRPFQL